MNAFCAFAFGMQMHKMNESGIGSNKKLSFGFQTRLQVQCSQHLQLIAQAAIDAHWQGHRES